jgi:hypothetical protein
MFKILYIIFFNLIFMTLISTMQRQKLPFWLLISGIILSTLQFMYGRSLWLDEISLSNNILQRDYAALLLPLANNQVAPILFLWVEKSFALLIPNSDYSLKIFPYCLYLAALFLFYKLVKQRFQNTYIQCFCLALFVFNGNLLNYSNEVKQYIGDVFVVVLFLYYYLCKQKNKRYFIEISLLGIFAILLSNIAIIILAVIGFTTVYEGFLNQKSTNTPFPKAIFGVCAVWIFTFALYFYGFVYEHPTTAAMRDFWANEGAFLPTNPFSFAFLAFLRHQIEVIFQSLLGFGKIIGFFVLLPILVLGLFSKQNTQKILFSAPIIIHLCLSALSLYPFNGRLILYIIPLLLLTLAEGALFLSANEKIKDFFEDKKQIFKPIFYLFILVLGGISAFLNGFPIEKQAAKPCLAFMQQHIEPKDKIYIYNGAAAAFRFYTENQKFAFSNEIIFGNAYRGENPKYALEIAQLHGNVWLFFSHVYEDEEAFICKTLEEKGFLPQKKLVTVGSSVYFYRLGNE